MNPESILEFMIVVIGALIVVGVVIESWQIWARRYEHRDDDAARARIRRELQRRGR